MWSWTRIPERGVRRRVTSFWGKNFESQVPDRFLAAKFVAIDEFFLDNIFFYPFHRLERKGGRCCGRPFIDLYSPLPFVSHPPLRSTRDGYLLNARVPFVPAVYEQLRTTSTKFHVSLDQIEFARPRKRPSRSQSPVPSILTSLPETRLSNTLLRNIYPSYLFQYSCVYIYIYFPFTIKLS